MDTAITTLVSSVVGSGVVASAVVFLARTWISERLKNAIKHEYDQKLEALKAALKAEHETELERLRSHLSVLAAEHHVRFVHQYDEMASVITEVYRYLAEAYDAVAAYVKQVEFGDAPWAERRRIVGEKLTELRSYLNVKQIYLPRGTAKRLTDFQEKLHRVADHFLNRVETVREETGRPEPGAWKEIWDSLTEEVKPLRAELEDEFRDLLGFSSRWTAEDKASLDYDVDGESESDCESAQLTQSPCSSKTLDAPTRCGRLSQVKRATILATLDECGGNRTHAAKKLGISRRALLYKLHDIEAGPT